MSGFTDYDWWLTLPDDKPAFEVRDFEGGKIFRIWADGRVAGFEELKSCVVVNRIPRLVQS